MIRAGMSVAVLAFLIAGCALPPAQPKIRLLTTFDKVQAEKLLMDGPNTIKGSSLMRQVNGGVVTCAGESVQLLPATTYAAERVRHIYGSDTAGIRLASVAQSNPEPFETTDPDFESRFKNTTCDAQGYFKFERVADGEFFVLSGIVWKANPRSVIFEGGFMMRRIKVQGGETKELVLTPQ